MTRYLFSHWEDENGNSIGTASTMTVTILADTFLKAIYMAAPQYSLDIRISGEGSTNPIPGVYMFDEGVLVTVSATPNTGWQFEGWDLNGTPYFTNPLDVIMNSDAILTASFSETVEPPPPEQKLPAWIIAIPIIGAIISQKSKK